MNDHKSSARRVSEVPELLSFICRFSPQSTQAQALRASRSFFNVAAPILWESVKGAHHMLRLIPGVGVISDPSTGGVDWTITFPKHPGPANPDRFNLYAKFIKNLEVYPSSDALGFHGYTVKGWPRPSQIKPHPVLLPNLQQLTLTPSSVKSQDQFLWIRMFLSPSLRTIRVQSSLETFAPPDIRPLVANALLGHIKSICPHLHALSLFPVRPQTSDEYSMVEYWEPPERYYTQLTTLQLRELGCTIDIFDPDVVHILTQLCELERLEIYCIASRPGATRIAPPSLQLALPPTVRHFALYLGSQQLAFQTLVLGIFSQLTSLALSFDDGISDEDDDGGGDRSDEHWGTKLTVLISRACPNLTSLSLDFDEESSFNLSSISIIHPLSALPLRNIRLRNIIPLSDPVLEEMHNIFPRARKIEIPDLVFELGELYYFSRFPDLEHLVIGLSAMSIPSASDPAPTLAPKFRILESTNAVEVSVNLSPFARYLLSFWPNLERVLWVEYECLNPLHSNHDHKDAVLAGALNTLIEIYRTSADPRRSIGV